MFYLTVSFGSLLEYYNPAKCIKHYECWHIFCITSSGPHFQLGDGYLSDQGRWHISVS